MRWVLAAFLAAGAAACGASREDWPEGRPRIDQLSFLQQSSKDPLALSFQLVFVDADGDLGGGRVRLTVEGNDRSSLPLGELFRAQIPPIALDAAEGELEVEVKLDELPAPGDRIEIGFVLEDAQGQESNEPTISLRAGAI